MAAGPVGRFVADRTSFTKWKYILSYVTIELKSENTTSDPESASKQSFDWASATFA